MANRWTPRGFVRTPSLLQRCWVVDGKQPSGKTKDLYDSAVLQKLLDELGLSLLDASNKSEWHNITDQRRLLLARYPRYQPKLPPNGPLPPLSPKGLYRHAAGASVSGRQHANLSLGET